MLENTSNSTIEHNYRADIDGLRAISVVAVIIFHFRPSLLPGGFLGVDAFFVISGFLITGILIREYENGGIKFGNFWKRRIRRLLPAYAAMTVSVAAISVLLLPASASHALGKQSIAATTGVANLYLLASTRDYWSSAAEWITFLHTWSLSVEEQFYLLYPVIFWIFAGFGRRALVWALAGGLIVSAYFSLDVGSSEPAKAFFLTPCRAWELLAGAVAGLMPMASRDNPLARIMGPLGLLLVTGSICFMTGHGFVPIPGAVLVVIGSALLCWSGKNHVYEIRWLGSGPFRYIGKASYSLYLWHWPALVTGSMLALLCPESGAREVALLLGLVAGFVSYHWVEPVGRRSDFLTKNAPYMIGALLIVSLGLAQFPDERPKSLNNDADGPNHISSTKSSMRYPAPLVEESKTPLVALVGDSNAVRLSPALRRACMAYDMNYCKHAVNGMAIAQTSNIVSKESVKKWAQCMDERDALVADLKPDFILLACRWDLCANTANFIEIAEVLERWKRLAPGARLIFVKQPPLLRIGCFNPSEFEKWGKKLGGIGVSLAESHDELVAEQYLDFLALSFGIETVSTGDALDIFMVLRGLSRHQLYTDSNHISPTGADMLTESIIFQITPKPTK